LSVHSPVGAAGPVRAWWNRLSLFWRAQIVGWGLFAVIVLVHEYLIYHDLSIDLSRTTLIVPCLVLLSVVMRSVYASPQFGNRLTVHAAGWVTLLSVGGAALIAALMQAAGEVMDWTAPGRDPVDDFVLPWTNYSVALVGWSLCYFWAHAEIAQRVEQDRKSACRERV